MRARILSPTSENIQKAAFAIRNHAVIAMPTETVYGLAGNISSPEALARIFDTKERPTFDPLIVHVPPEANTIAQLEKLKIVDATPLSAILIEKINRILAQFWPGPLTLVLPKHSNVPDLATSGLTTVGVRMPKHPVAQALIQTSGCALAAPSANRFGRISPTTPHAVAEELGDRIDWILDGGSCQVGVESTIVMVSLEAQSLGQLKLLRPGGTPKEDLENFLGEPLLSHSTFAKTKASGFLAPGMTESHYAPTKQLILLKKPIREWNEDNFKDFTRMIEKLSPSESIALLLLQGGAAVPSHPKLVTQVLSEKGDLKEMAQRLFMTLRNLDSSDATLLFAEPCLETKGLGYAIQDRLKRASTRTFP